MDYSLNQKERWTDRDTRHADAEESSDDDDLTPESGVHRFGGDLLVDATILQATENAQWDILRLTTIPLTDLLARLGIDVRDTFDRFRSAFAQLRIASVVSLPPVIASPATLILSISDRGFVRWCSVRQILAWLLVLYDENRVISEKIRSDILGQGCIASEWLLWESILFVFDVPRLHNDWFQVTKRRKGSSVVRRSGLPRHEKASFCTFIETFLRRWFLFELDDAFSRGFASIVHDDYGTFNASEMLFERFFE